MVRILGSLLGLLVALLIMFLLGSSFLISSDLIRGDLYDKYRNDKSFLYRIESGTTVHIRDEGNRAGPPLVLLHGAYASVHAWDCLLYTSPSPRDATLSRMPSSA